MYRLPDEATPEQSLSERLHLSYVGQVGQKHVPAEVEHLPYLWVWAMDDGQRCEDALYAVTPQAMAARDVYVHGQRVDPRLIDLVFGVTTLEAYHHLMDRAHELLKPEQIDAGICERDEHTWGVRITWDAYHHPYMWWLYEHEIMTLLPREVQRQPVIDEAGLIVEDTPIWGIDAMIDWRRHTLVVDDGTVGDELAITCAMAMAPPDVQLAATLALDRWQSSYQLPAGWMPWHGDMPWWAHHALVPPAACTQ
ncbi:MAG: hypothetical protein D6790_06485 [Caldilineae bacterium]|nr:MAG: hypothetical protein D6790_06485 [Caldilineae bacterium]